MGIRSDSDARSIYHTNKTDVEFCDHYIENEKSEGVNVYYRNDCHNNYNKKTSQGEEEKRSEK
jgi:hypothetical protein